ncbi:hypothetical protein LCGC14_0258200 [marine sediment metagenome]|uniref:Uncharacterized protein n=1 Tax=marine sediment metagenome TaxID=412755 RepID=A0A0F9WMN9_9ZZZZ
MKTTEKLRGEAYVAHELEMAIRRERSFWQLVVILMTVFGVVGGGLGVRCGLDQTPNATLISDAVMVPKLKAEMEQLRGECALPVIAALCPADPLGRHCAVSWQTIRASTNSPWTFVGCDDGQRWRVHWVTMDQVNPEDPAP